MAPTFLTKPLWCRVMIFARQAREVLGSIPNSGRKILENGNFLSTECPALLKAI